jgi:hypothetical protein
MVKRASQQVFARRVGIESGLVERLLDVVGEIPESDEPAAADPRARSRLIARRATAKAASTAGTLALPPGPLGWITIAPELYAVWKIQAQMVADIAAAHGKHGLLTREQMLYCLFSHTAASAFRDLVIRAGERYVVRRAPLSALYAIANKVAIRIAQRSASRLVTRWIPVLGAIGVAGYVFVDSGRVADAAMALFAADLVVEHDEEEDLDAKPARPRATSTPRRAGPAARKPAAPRARGQKASPDGVAADLAAPAGPAAGKPAVRRKATGKRATTGKAPAGEPRPGG